MSAASFAISPSFAGGSVEKSGTAASSSVVSIGDPDDGFGEVKLSRFPVTPTPIAARGTLPPVRPAPQGDGMVPGNPARIDLHQVQESYSCHA
jgi:hypothetical protein